MSQITENDIMNKLQKKYFLIDESGDPNFYANRKKLLIGTSGFQPYLIIGMVETNNRKILHKTVVNFMEKIKSDKMYKTIPSVAKKDWYLHANRDHPEVRAKFFEVIRSLNCIKAHVVIGKKDLNIFNQKHNNNPTEFYFDLMYHLISNKLNSECLDYNLYLSQKGNSTVNRFEEAVQKAINADNKKRDFVLNVNYKLEIVSNHELPELSIIDYMLWAMQRKILTGENRFFDALEDKFETVIDLYGT